MLKIHLFSCLFCLLFSIPIREPLKTHSSREGNVVWLWEEETFSLPKMLQEFGNKKRGKYKC